MNRGENKMNAFTKTANAIYTEICERSFARVETVLGTVHVEIKSDELHTFVEFYCNGEKSTMTHKGGAERFAAHLEAFLFFKLGLDSDIEIIEGETFREYIAEDSGWDHKEMSFSAEQHFLAVVNGIIVFKFYAFTQAEGARAKFQRFPYKCSWHYDLTDIDYDVVNLSAEEGDRRNPAAMLAWA